MAELAVLLPLCITAKQQGCHAAPAELTPARHGGPHSLSQPGSDSGTPFPRVAQCHSQVRGQQEVPLNFCYFPMLFTTFCSHPPSKLCPLSAVCYFHTVICLKKKCSLTHTHTPPHPSSNSPVEPAVPETTRSYFLSFKLPLSGKPHPLRCAAGHTYECVRGKGVCSPGDKVELANKLFPHLTWHTPERNDVCVLMHEQADFLEAINRTGRTCKIGLRAPTQAHTNTES